MKVRARFTKLGRVRWTSHRDVARMWERALRLCSAPVAYTAGFTPRPQLSFGLALPTGCESVAEYLDITFTEHADPETLGAALGAALPEGVDVTAAGIVEPGARSLQEDVTVCSWEIAVPAATATQTTEAIDRALSAEHLEVTRERKGRMVTDDLRPSVRALWCHDSAEDGVRLFAELGTQPRGVRPAELARAMGIDLGPARRTCQWIERDGSRWEPLAAQIAGATALAAGAS